MTQQATVKVRGVGFYVGYSHIKSTPNTMYSHNAEAGDEGESEKVNIQTIIHNGEDLFEVFEDDLIKFEEAILEHIHGNNY